MASLNSLLNPESSQERDMRLQQHAQQQSSSSPSPPPPNTMAYERAAAESNYYAQTDIVMRPHESHPDCPDTLACLPDTNGRPQHTLPVILRCAILGSPKKRLTIREIYAAMEKKYPYYKTAGPAWKQSVRHHLSLNRLFERQQRPATDPGFGSYWTVNLEAPPGTKRPRKRGRTQKEIIIQTNPGPMIERPYIPMQIRVEHHQPAPAPQPLLPSPPQQRTVPPPLPPPPPPRREDSSHSTHGTHSTRGPHQPVASASSTRLRPVDAHSFQTSAVRGSPYDDEDDDEMDWGPGGPQTISDDDFSEDEPMIHTTTYPHYQSPLSASSSSSTNTSYHHPPAHSPVNHTHSIHSHSSHTNHAIHSRRPGLQGSFSSSYQPAIAPPPEDPAVTRLKQEIEALKRHSSDQEALTIRLSNSLTRAETDAARAKQALKMADSRLEDETRRRVEAERAADEEARLRRMAEERLRSYQSRHGLASL
ncbi:uncharacterized protein PHACADRAFT_204842 [Phanerochaete carnosa HHB-10118-sp]|uniref:Fork-head domain-containing protein n=1 Tax=Phanerochaete carnosa (strain HHB-10118-sp) TaxID=650164 RepID=K5WCH8_PHACS|nr:uncharacterized protein PHACADRAFT_204842 [Phanerochaete carnosa HHB-10118-sp]EKM61673.1 hypothetical protein PHACADRAFT_204842 [Phanerochaete carnosa HHB-10118-sp]